MKKHIYLLFFLTFLYSSTMLVKAQFVWAKSFGSNQPEEGKSIAVDVFGNVYSVGTFTGTVDFDPSAGVFNLTSAGGTDIYISKLDASGNFLWAKNLGGTGNDMPLSVTTDGSGNVYTTGFYLATADFDPNGGVFNLVSSAGADIFVSKLDASGNFVWAKSMGGVGTTDQAKGVVVDASNNVYLTGFFSSTADFDPNAGVFNLTSAGGNDIFIVKLDASGNFVWANKVGGSGADQGNGIALDASNNVHITGFFTSANVDFDSGAGTAIKTSASSDIFVLKLSTVGAYIWVSTMGGTGIDEGNTIDIDASGNVYTSGRFFGVSSDFDPGAGAFNQSSAGSSDVFVSKLNSSGNFVWAKRVGGPRPDVGFSLSVDLGGNVYTTGNFQTFTAEVADFDPNAGTFNLVSQALTVDVFMFSLDASGNFRCAGKVGGSGTDDGASITTDASGNTYMTGKFVSTVDFDPFAGVFNLGGNNFDPFVLKLSGCSVVLPVTLINFESTCRDKKNTITWITATEVNNDYFILEKSYDAVTFFELVEIQGAGNSNVINNYSVTDPNSFSGSTYYRLKQVDFDGATTYHKIITTNCNVNDFEVNQVIFNSNSLNFNIITDTDEELIIYLYDYSGRLVSYDNKKIKKGNNSIQFDNLQISSGIYMLSIIGKYNVHSIKLRNIK